jgi:t-SNARE complex subunit (syntaxin)
VNEIVLNQCTKDLGDVMAQTQQYAGQIKKRLAAIKTSNDQESKEGAQADIREGLYQQHIRRFHKTMNEYNSAVYAYKKNMQDRQRRQLNIVTDNKYSEEELDEIIDAGQAGQVISDVLFTDTMEDTLQDIRDRNEAIQNLEQSVMEIYELFQDLSNLVDLQSESLDVIEHKVGKSKQYLKDGHKNVVKSQDYVKKSRKTKCFLLLLLLAILIAVLVAVLVPALSKA